MYLIKDQRSYAYKLVPTINDENLLMLKNEHHASKALNTVRFKDFVRENAFRYLDVSNVMLKDPEHYNPLPDHPHELRVLAREAKKARNMIFKHKRQEVNI